MFLTFSGNRDALVWWSRALYARQRTFQSYGNGPRGNFCSRGHSTVVRASTVRTMHMAAGRLALGFRLYSPSTWEEIRALPPMSVPKPTILPCRVSNVPSTSGATRGKLGVFRMHAQEVQKNKGTLGFTPLVDVSARSSQDRKDRGSLRTMILCGWLDLAIIIVPIYFNSAT